MFAVKFRPGGFYPFAGFPISSLSDKTVELAEVFGADGEKLDRAVLAEDTDDGRVAVIETFLRNRRPAPDDNVTRLAEMVYAVARERGSSRWRTWSSGTASTSAPSSACSPSMSE